MSRLDGMPLAIELAAARVEALGLAQLLDRLDDRLELLAGGDRLAAGRHRSLAAAVEWSYQLLDEAGAAGVPPLSVFPAPFTLQAAEAVAGEARRRRCCAWWTARCWSRRGGPDGRARYVMLETLRAYGGGLLAAVGEQDQAAAALARYALGVAEEAAAGLTSTQGSWPRPGGWMPRTPPWGLCWPGRCSMTWTWRRGW